jgi:hypothetical protein
MSQQVSVDKAKANPSKVFNSPEDVLSSGLTKTAKLAILRSWEDEAHQLQAAADENMTGGEASRLDEIRKAIDKLEDDKM